MNSLIDNYDFNKEAEEIRKRQNKVFSKDNKIYIPEKYINLIKADEKKIYKEIQNTYNDLETCKSKFRNSILRILDELEKEQLKVGENSLYIPIRDYVFKLYFYKDFVVDPISSVFDDII